MTEQIKMGTLGWKEGERSILGMSLGTHVFRNISLRLITNIEVT